MSANYTRLKDTAADMIERWGMPAVLRRASGDRPCRIAVLEYNAFEKHQLTNPTARKVLLSARDLAVPPDEEQDRLVTFVQPMVDGVDPVEDETLFIAGPPGKIVTGGIVVVWRLQVQA